MEDIHSSRACIIELWGLSPSPPRSLGGGGQGASAEADLMCPRAESRGREAELMCPRAETRGLKGWPLYPSAAADVLSCLALGLLRIRHST